jgi:transcriptional regulator GlxA family with amidase domain
VDDVDVALPTETAETLPQFSATARADTAARFRISGRVITAAAAGGALEAALHLVSSLLGKKQAEVVSRALGVTFTASDPGAVSIVDRTE